MFYKVNLDGVIKLFEKICLDVEKCFKCYVMMVGFDLEKIWKKKEVIEDVKVFVDDE